MKNAIIRCEDAISRRENAIFMCKECSNLALKNDVIAKATSTKLPISQLNETGIHNMA